MPSNALNQNDTNAASNGWRAQSTDAATAGNLASDIRALSKGLGCLLKYEPEIRPNFAGADLATTAAAMRVAIGRGVSTPRAIHKYLSGRGSPYDLPTIQFLLDAYTGLDRAHCLWSRASTGKYVLLGDR